MSTPLQRLSFYAFTLFVASLTFFTQPVLAQSHYQIPTDRSGNNATIIIPRSAVAMNGASALETDDEIGVFSETGLCVGASVWSGENLAITIWGDDVLSNEVEGLRMDEPFTLRIWRVDAEEEITAESGQLEIAFSTDRPYYRKEATYAPNAIFVVERLRISEPAAAGDTPY